MCGKNDTDKSGNTALKYVENVETQTCVAELFNKHDAFMNNVCD